MPRILGLLGLLLATGCLTVQPAQRYDTSRGLVISGSGIGTVGYETTGDPAIRAARTAAILEALGAWCEQLADILEDARLADEELPEELYDPEAPPDDLSNLLPYRDDLEALAGRLHLRHETLPAAGEGEQGYDLWCTLRDGVQFHHVSRFDAFEVQTVARSELQVDESSGYFRPVTVLVDNGALVEPAPDLIPMEYLERLLEGHRIQVREGQVRSPGQSSRSVTLAHRMSAR